MYVWKRSFRAGGTIMVCSGLDTTSLTISIKNKTLSIIKHFEKWKLFKEHKNMYIRHILVVISSENKKMN